MRIIKPFLSFNPVSISTFVILLVLVMFSTGVEIFELFELKTYDQRLLWRGIREPSPYVVGAVIDEKSLDREGVWPWPRQKIAHLIDKLSDDGAKVIGFDIFFAEPAKSINFEVINQVETKLNELNIKDQEITDYLKKVKHKTDSDALFAESIKNSKAKVILSYFWHTSQRSLGYEISPEELDNRYNSLNNSAYITKRDSRDDFDPFEFADIHPYAPEVNLKILTEAAAGSGYINPGYLIDGVIREMPLAIEFKGNIYTPLSVQCAWKFLESSNPILNIGSGFGIEGVNLGPVFIPTDEDGKILVNYMGPSGSVPHYSITDILNDNFEKGTFEGKIVIVGSTAEGAHDMRNTPFDPNQPGFEIHATIIDNIIREDFISKPGWTRTYDALAIIILGIFIAYIIPHSGALKGVVSTFIAIVFHIMMCIYLFSSYGLWINMVYPVLGIALLYASLTTYHFLVEEKNKRFLHSTFASYLSPDLIEDMVSSETMPELGGEARVITAYFTDIQSFSAFSEKLTAQQLVELLNEYLTAMTDILLNERGTLDKYEGDAIIAFMGAPVMIPDHTLRACRVAIDMQGELSDLREKWRNETQEHGEAERNTKHLPPEEWPPGAKWPKVVHDMMMRIGINSGEIVVGNMGSSMRMNYTMMGDSVNLAARLEEGAKQYGIYTAVSEYTLNREFVNEQGLKDKAMNYVEARFIDNIMVVGKSEPVKIYELCAMKGELTEKEKTLFNLFDQGIQYYLDMRWDAAIECFKESLKFERIPEGKTTPSEVYIKRCETFKENPPVSEGQKWDGVYRMTEK
jgi:adenylate cyclase